MEQLFAPWRIEWVKRDADPGVECVFCELPERTDERDALVVAKAEHTYVLMNNAPYNPGHAMVIPYRHVCDYDALSSVELLELGQLKQATLAAMEAAFEPDGFNMGYNLGGAGGGSIDHVHSHVVPRWRGDTNFMAVLDETKVIVQALEETYDELRDALNERPAAVSGSDAGAAELSFDLDVSVSVDEDSP